MLRASHTAAAASRQALTPPCRRAGNKLDTAREFKKIVFYSNMVLQPLVTAVKDDNAAAMQELADTLAKAKAEVEADAAAEAREDAGGAGESAASTDVDDGTEYTAGDEREESHAGAEVTDDEGRAARTSAADEAVAAAAAAADGEGGDKGDKSQQEVVAALRAQSDTARETAAEATLKGTPSQTSQKEINLADELDKQARIDLYRNYLEFAMQGDVMVLPMGGIIRLRRDEREFERLSQWGEVLGLTQMDVYPLHQEFMEMGFKQQVEAAAPQGVLSEEDSNELKEMAGKMGVAPDKAAKIMRDVTNKPIIGKMQSMQDAGELTFDKARFRLHLLLQLLRVCLLVAADRERLLLSLGCAANLQSYCMATYVPLKVHMIVAAELFCNFSDGDVFTCSVFCCQTTFRLRPAIHSM